MSGYEASGWLGLVAPKSTPADVIDRLNKEIAAALQDPKVKARLHDLGGEPLPLGPDEFKSLIVAETEKWGRVIRGAKIKAN